MIVPVDFVNFYILVLIFIYNRYGVGNNDRKLPVSTMIIEAVHAVKVGASSVQ